MTRDEPADGPLARALRAHGCEPCACPVLDAGPPVDAAPLVEAARLLERYDVVVAASARAVQAVTAARGRPWPRGTVTAAVGPATARALQEAGVAHPPIVAPGDGAEPLWDVLAARPWRGRTVLVLTTPGGRTLLADRLREAGARVHAVEAYRMTPRPAEAIAAAWTAARADAVVVASPRVADTLIAAIGREALGRVRVVAIGATTAAALGAHGVTCIVADAASLEAAAAAVAAVLGSPA